MKTNGKTMFHHLLPKHRRQQQKSQQCRRLLIRSNESCNVFHSTLFPNWIFINIETHRHVRLKYSLETSLLPLSSELSIQTKWKHKRLFLASKNMYYRICVILIITKTAQKNEKEAHFLTFDWKMRLLSLSFASNRCLHFVRSSHRLYWVGGVCTYFPKYVYKKNTVCPSVSQTREYIQQKWFNHTLFNRRQM